MHSAAATGIRRTLDRADEPPDDAGGPRAGRSPNRRSWCPTWTRFGWTHYGVMIPDLPEPHRFFRPCR